MKYINREISWLAFNERVLQEAADPTVPLIERLKFLGIYSSNLDEFYRVRVATLTRMVEANIDGKEVLGESASDTLEAIRAKVLLQRKFFDRVFTGLYQELEKRNIYIVDEYNLDASQTEFVKEYFESKVRPRLSPVMLKSVPKFPYLKNQTIYLAIHLLKKAKPTEFAYAMIELPADVLPRFIQLPSHSGKTCLIMLDDIIRYGLKDIFYIFDYDVFSAYTIKITRDAELEIADDQDSSLLEKISRSVKQRAFGKPVRFVYDREIPPDFLNFILKKLKLTKFNNLIPGGRYHNARDFMKFPNIGISDLFNPDREMLSHASFEGSKTLFGAVKQQDILLHYPYHSFRYTIDFLREAAIDPKVKSIHMTLYRVAKNSNVVNALINALRNGKKVTVLLELKARFDEESNIFWTKKLQQEGAKLIEGISGMKVHAKLCMATRREDGKDVRYAIIGTGNFHEVTAKIYTDHALFTSHEEITGEVYKVFKFLEKSYKTYKYKHLLTSPSLMRRRLKAKIKAEIRNAAAGKEAFIYLKLNSLVDPEIIEDLYSASKRGVRIKMIVRGICSLVPGVPGLSENIEVVSIVDKYLEHSRILVFCNGGETQYYISSADWMVRNLDKRVEVAVPIYDENLQEELKNYLDIQFRDNCKGRFMEGIESKQPEPPAKGLRRAQDDIYDYLQNL